MYEDDCPTCKGKEKERFQSVSVKLRSLEMTTQQQEGTHGL